MIEPLVHPLDDRRIERILSAREHEVMEAICLGLTNRQAAEKLTVTVHTVKFHLASIYGKLGVANRTEAAAFYVRTASSSVSGPPDRG